MADVPVFFLRFPQAVFRATGAFAARDAAERWCAERGVSVGRAQRGSPCGLLYGDFDIQKWRSLRPDDLAALDGIMVGDMREGPVAVYLRAARPGQPVAHGIVPQDGDRGTGEGS